MNFNNPKKEELVEIGEQLLDLILDRQGEVIYSSHSTLKKGDLYVLGLNPGGEGFITIREHLNQLLSRNENSFLDEKWKNRISEWNKGEAPLQKRVINLLESIGYNPREVCSSNLIFVTSRTAEEVNYGLAGYCWKFHEAVLKIVQPKVILCFGISKISSYSFLNEILGGKETTKKAGHGNWDCKAFKTKLHGRDITVVGVPHLSYYNITDKTDVISWIKGFLD